MAVTPVHQRSELREFQRSPLRIPGFLKAVEAIWLENPEMRFGQLVMNLSREPGGFADTWNWEDSDWHRRFQRYADEGWKSGV